MDSITLNILRSLGPDFELISALTQDLGASLHISVLGGASGSFFDALNSVDFSSLLELYPLGVTIVRFNNRSSDYVDSFIYTSSGSSTYSRCK